MLSAAGLLPSELHDRHWHIILRSESSHFPAIGLILAAGDGPVRRLKNALYLRFMTVLVVPLCRSKGLGRFANHRIVAAKLEFP
jgi:hypothetical protein